MFQRQNQRLQITLYLKDVILLQKQKKINRKCKIQQKVNLLKLEKLRLQSGDVKFISDRLKKSQDFKLKRI